MVLFTIGVWIHPKVLMVRGSVSLKLPRSRYLGSLHASGTSTVWLQTVKVDCFRVADQSSTIAKFKANWSTAESWLPGRPQRVGCLSPDIFRLYSPLVAGWYVPARR